MIDPYDEFGSIINPAEAQQQIMLGLYDLRVEARDAGFSDEAIAAFEKVRLQMMDEFEKAHPGYGKGRATWR